MVGKNGMEIGCLLEEEFQKVNLMCYGKQQLLFVLKLLKTYSDVVDSFSSERKLRNSGE